MHRFRDVSDYEDDEYNHDETNYEDEDDEEDERMYEEEEEEDFVPSLPERISTRLTATRVKKPKPVQIPDLNNLRDSFFRPLMYVLYKTVSFYFLVVVVHYAGANLYNYFCTPQSMVGFVMSPLMVPSPHCEGLRWIVYHGAVRINAMWLMLGSHVVDYVAAIFAS
jgi:hypothetical protein